MAQQVYNASKGTGSGEDNAPVHFVIASSGNAALSLAHVASKLPGSKCSVFITKDAANPGVLSTLKRCGADVVVAGNKYFEALKEARDFVDVNPNAIMMPAYDHPTLWQGASTIIDEVAEQLPASMGPPHAIICSVGGGSLLGGQLIGCERHGWDQTRVIAVETTGSDTLYHSVLLTESPDHVLPSEAEVIVDEKRGVKLVTKAPTSRATSLGASISAAGVVEMAYARRRRDKGLLTCVNIPDEMAMIGCLEFADEHKTLVDLACGATMAPAYDAQLFEKIFGSDFASVKTVDHERPTIVFVVCGGSKVSLKDMDSYAAHLESVKGQKREFRVDEEVVAVL